MGVLSCIAWIETIIITIILLMVIWEVMMHCDDDITIIREIKFILPEDDKDDEDKSKEKKENKSQSKR